RERVKIATLRLYSVYGPWEDPGRLMPTMVVQGLAGRLPPLVDPRVARDYVYVDDVSEAFVRAAAKPHPEPGPVFNVGSGEQTTIGVAGTFNVGYTTHPPTAGLFALPLAGLDYRAALLAWNLIGLAILVATIRLVVRELGWSPERSTVLIGVALLMAWVPLW